MARPIVRNCESKESCGKVGRAGCYLRFIINRRKWVSVWKRIKI